MRRSSRILSLLAIVLSLALVAGACGGDDDTSSGSTDAGGGKDDSAQTNDVNPTPRDEVVDGGTLTWALTSMPGNFNYNQVDGTEKDAADVYQGTLPYVFEFKADATPVLRTEYVTSAEVTSSDPKQVVTYKLNKKAKWSDGKPITVADYEAQWKALSGTNEAFDVSSTTGYDQIESVAKGADEYEVVVTFAKPFADWRSLFSYLYPAATNADPKVFNEGWVNGFPVTAGPFKLQAIDQTAKTITVVRDDTWWGEKAKLDRIVYRAIEVDATVDALLNGEIDFMDIGPDLDALKRAEAAPGIEIRRAAGPNFRHFDFNGTSEVLKDVKVRKAIAMGINRSTIAKALVGPLGGNIPVLNNHLFMTNQGGYKNNAGEVASRDVAGAKKLLDEAGWTASGAGTRTKGGKPLSVRFVIPSEVTTSAQEGELAQGMLKEIGVDLKVEVVPSDDFFEKYITPGNFDMTTFSWIGTQFPISSSISIYEMPKGEEIQQNYARVGSEELDAKLNAAAAELDPEKAIDLANEADAMIWDLVHSLTLYQRPDIIAAKPKLANYGATGFASIAYEDIGFTK